ncbi:hypothetical protein O6H91_21G010200 [Diphasiastrum complanatum]|uniref:Uncharacterized protein n=1 Tax=Diphasiastrum complanatum TaxID=34168 RepID=A0ACC2AI09_DIPCM|nr:hypothetical protein O6H91_21G010200 [Diphasiastrum complanatum]
MGLIQKLTVNESRRLTNRILQQSPGCGPQGNSADSKVLSFSDSKDCRLDRRNRTSSKTIAQTFSETKKSAATATRTKFEKNSAPFPSRVIVRDLSTGEANSDESGVSCHRQEVLVMEKDDLNERIEDFFARFREQLRQESLNSQ